MINYLQDGDATGARVLGEVRGLRARVKLADEKPQAHAAAPRRFARQPLAYICPVS
jgi:hypothetical protein